MHPSSNSEFRRISNTRVKFCEKVVNIWNYLRNGPTSSCHGKISLTSFASVYSPSISLAINPCRQCWTGVSFEARGRTFRLVVFHSMSGTLISIFEGFFLLFYYCNLFLLRQDNRILRLNSSKLSHYFFFLYLSSGIFDWFPRRFRSTKLKWSFRFHSCSAKVKGKSQAKHSTHVGRTENAPKNFAVCYWISPICA